MQCVLETQFAGLSLRNRLIPMTWLFHNPSRLAFVGTPEPEGEQLDQQRGYPAAQSAHPTRRLTGRPTHPARNNLGSNRPRSHRRLSRADVAYSSIRPFRYVAATSPSADGLRQPDRKAGTAAAGPAGCLNRSSAPTLWRLAPHPAPQAVHASAGRETVAPAGDGRKFAKWIVWEEPTADPTARAIRG
jgi:hypothetical protein